jgi:hypothetical protein
VTGGFLFYASDDRFAELDGRMFPRARAIERQLRRTARQRLDSGSRRPGTVPA